MRTTGTTAARSAHGKSADGSLPEPAIGTAGSLAEPAIGIAGSLAEPAIGTAGSIPPHDGSHPVRLVLLLEMFALLSEYGYRRPSTARSTAQSLRLLNALADAFEAGR